MSTITDQMNVILDTLVNNNTILSADRSYFISAINQMQLDPEYKRGMFNAIKTAIDTDFQTLSDNYDASTAVLVGLENNINDATDDFEVRQAALRSTLTGRYEPAENGNIVELNKNYIGIGDNCEIVFPETTHDDAGAIIGVAVVNLRQNSKKPFISLKDSSTISYNGVEYGSTTGNGTKFQLKSSVTFTRTKEGWVSNVGTYTHPNPKRIKLTTSGTFTPDPVHIAAALVPKITMVGGGGAGGSGYMGGSTTTNAGIGGDGGSGANSVQFYYIPDDPAVGVPFIIGAGGSGGNAALKNTTSADGFAGGDGGDTIFGTVTTRGGRGGAGGSGNLANGTDFPIDPSKTPTAPSVDPTFTTDTQYRLEQQIQGGFGGDGYLNTITNTTELENDNFDVVSPSGEDTSTHIGGVGGTRDNTSLILGGGGGGASGLGRGGRGGDASSHIASNGGDAVPYGAAGGGSGATDNAVYGTGRGGNGSDGVIIIEYVTLPGEDPVE